MIHPKRIWRGCVPILALAAFCSGCILPVAAEEPVTTAPATTAETAAAPADPLAHISYTVTDGAVTLTRYQWLNEWDITIPDTIAGYPVTEIAPFAFQYCYADSVRLPDTVQTIGTSAFAGCVYLQEMVIPAACKTIADAAFANCNRLQTVQLPQSVSHIGKDAFAGTPYLTAQLAADPFVILGDGFLYAYGGTEADVTIPDTVKTIGFAAFAGCQTLTSVTLPESVTKVLGEAFARCAALTTVTVSQAPNTLAPDAFAETPWFTAGTEPFVRLGSLLVAYHGTEAKVTVPEGITVIGAKAFAGNVTMTTLTVSEGVRELRSSVCENCPSLQVVKLSDTVTSIAAAAFADCSRLAFISVGNSLQSIGADAFLACSQLTHLTLPETVAQIGDRAIGYQWDTESAQYLPRPSVSLFSNAPAVQKYAAAVGIACETISASTHTEPLVTSAVSTTTIPSLTRSPAHASQDAVPAAAIGGALVLLALCLRVVEWRKRR